MAESVMTEVRLYGELGDRFGRVRRLQLSSPREALQALCSTVKGFRAYLLQHSEPGYRILVGGRDTGRDAREARPGQDVAEGASTVAVEDLPVDTGGQVIRIVPVYAGGKDAWVGIAIGVILIAATYGLGATAAGAAYAGLATSVGNIGIAMVVGGVSQLLAGTPKLNPAGGVGSSSRSQSYLFGGPANTVTQGGPVPVGWGGPLRVGGVVISGGIVPEALNNKGQFGQVGDGLGTLTGDGDATPWVASVAVE